ncbi:hypothetical protein Tco_0510681 [Tanacetum coccineum]
MKPEPSSVFKHQSQGSPRQKPRARSGLRRKQSSKHTSESKTEASKSKTGQSDKETQSSLVKDKSPSHPSPSILVVGEMHKEAQQAAGGPTSLGETLKKDPTLSLVVSASGCDALANSTTEADPGIFAPNDFIPEQHEDLSNLMQDTRTSFLTPNSPRDEPTIVSDESEEEETERYEDTHTTSHDGPEDTSIQHPPSPKSVQIQELMAQVQLLQSQKQPRTKAKAEAEFAP